MYQSLSTLKKCQLLSISSYHSFSLATKLESFFIHQSISKTSLLNKSIDQQKECLIYALNAIIRPLESNSHKAWVMLLFIDTFVSTFQTSLLGHQLIDFLCEIIKNLSNDYNQVQIIKNSINPQDTTKKQLKNAFTRGFSGLKTLIDFTPKQILTQPNQIQHVETILKGILFYEHKKLQNFEFFQSVRYQFERNQSTFLPSKQEQSQNLSQIVWKIINLIKIHSTIITNYKKIASFLKSIKPLMVATIHRFCKDLLMFYPYITECIELAIKEIQQKYDQIMGQKLPNQIKKNRLQKLGKAKEFIELKNLIEDLSQINQTMLYLFCSNEHCMYFDFQTPKQFFLSTNNHRLDKIYKIISQVKKIDQKNYFSKQYISQLVQKMDESVSKLIQKNKLIKSCKNISDEAIEKQSCEPTYDEQRYIKQNKTKNRLRNPQFFQQMTDHI